MRSSRLLSLLLLLQSRQQMTARELADELEVSLRTVYRDVEALAASGVPVYAEHGRAGGYRLVDGYRTRLTGLTTHEAESLFLVGLPGAAEALGVGPEAASAELKLLASLGREQRSRAARLRERFHVDLPAWYQPSAPAPHLTTLAQAVLTDRWVQVTYRRWKAPREVERTLAPYGLVLKNGTWYAVAASRDASGPGADAARTYRVSNILALTVTDEPFERPAGFDLGAHWQRHLAAFESRRITGTAQVRVSPGLARSLPELGHTDLERAVAAGTPAPDGWVVAELPIESVEHAAQALVRHGTEVEVLSPPELRAELLGRAEGLVAMYADQPLRTTRVRS